MGYVLALPWPFASWLRCLSGPLLSLVCLGLVDGWWFISHGIVEPNATKLQTTAMASLPDPSAVVINMIKDCIRNAKDDYDKKRYIR